MHQSLFPQSLVHAAWRLLFFLALTTAALAQPEEVGDVDTRMEQARQLQIGGKLEEARAIYLDLIPRLRQQGPSKNLGDALNRMSLAANALGDYSQALQMAQEAAEVRRQLGNSVGEARSLNNTGLALLHLGEYEEAILKYQQALALDEQNQDFQGQVIRNNNIGNVYFYQGRYLDALRLYQTALELCQQNSAQPWSAEERQLSLANLAVVYQKLGQYQRALDLYVQLRREAGQLPASQEAQILSNQGTLYRHLGDPAMALENYRRALDLYSRQRLLDGEIAALKNTGIALALDLKDYQKALDTFSRVIEISRRASNRRQEVQARLYAAETLRRMGRLQEAQGQFQSVLTAARELGISEERWKALYGLGGIARSAGNLAEAKTLLQTAIQVIESERSRLRLTSLRTDFLADKGQVYDSLIGILIGDWAKGGQQSRSQLEEIFRLLEQAQARTFQDRYSSSLEERERQSNPQIVHQLRELRSKVARLWAQQLDAQGEEREELRARLSELENQFVAKERESLGSMPALFDPALTLKQAQRRVPEGGLVIQAWMDSEQVAFLWLDTDSAGLVTRSIDSGFQEELSNCLQSLSAPPEQAAMQPDPCPETEEALAAALAAAFPEGIESLIIVPSASFSSFPFEILPLPGGGRLVEAFSVSYLPSLALLDSASQPSSGNYAPWSNSLVAFANPRSAPMEAEEWADLPFAEEEVREIARSIPGSSRIYLGPAASKERFLEEAQASPLLLHLATHAWVDPADPQRSRILLGGGKQKGPEYLFLGEALSLDLPRTRLVTLSACETAGGSRAAGEVQDLGRAFLIAGAESTLAALWSVPDRTAAQFMPLFYRGLADGLSPAQALRQAKLRFIESGTALSLPYHWAGFVLYGQTSGPIPLPPSWRALLLPLAGILLILALILILRRSRGHS